MKFKIKRLPVSPETLLNVMKNKSAWRVMDGVPETAVLKGATIDPYTNVFYLFVHDESFEEVSVGYPVPILETSFVKIK